MSELKNVFSWSRVHLYAAMVMRRGRMLRLRRWRSISLVLAQVALLCGVKVLMHLAGYELLVVNQLFSAAVASTVFLLGFLLSGVLTDFKEAEKIPGRFAAELETLSLEIGAIPVFQPSAQVEQAQESVTVFGKLLVVWLCGNCETEKVLAAYRSTHADVVQAAVQYSGDVSTLRGRLMQSMSVILEMIYRVKVIRDTGFLPLVYWLANFSSTLLFGGLLLARANHWFDSLFFLAVISFVVLLILRLIGDIDNPFGLGDPDSAENVSIDVLERTVAFLE